MKNFIVYTDGSAVAIGKNKGRGGFGTYFPDDFFGKKAAYSLGYKNTKTGRMELMALYFAIKHFDKHLTFEPVVLTVYSDSEYVVKSFTEHRLERWINNGWRNSSGEVANIDLWKAIIHVLVERKYLTLKMKHIKSHQVEKAGKPKNQMLVNALMKNPHIRGNMIADRLADYKRHTNLKESDKL